MRPCKQTEGHLKRQTERHSERQAPIQLFFYETFLRCVDTSFCIDTHLATPIEVRYRKLVQRVLLWCRPRQSDRLHPPLIPHISQAWSLPPCFYSSYAPTPFRTHTPSCSDSTFPHRSRRAVWDGFNWHSN